MSLNSSPEELCDISQVLLDACILIARLSPPEASTALGQALGLAMANYAGEWSDDIWELVKRAARCECDHRLQEIAE